MILKILVMISSMSGEQVIHFFIALPYNNIFFYVHRYAFYVLVSCLDPHVFNFSLENQDALLRLEMEFQLYIIASYPRFEHFKF